MPRLRRPDGVEIEWQVQGAEGPLVALALMAVHPVGVSRSIAAELAVDHRVVTYHPRGNGASTRSGPYDMATGAADLAAVAEAAGGDALVVGLGDGARRAIRAAEDRPDLIHTVVVSGELPLGPITGSDGSTGEALSNSPAVLDALLGLMETDYRAGLRTMLTASGEGKWEEETVRTRIDSIEAECPREVAVARIRAWIEDDSRPHARALGDRLWFLHFPGNAWFQGTLEAIRRTVPEARFEPVSQGVITAPDENAAVIRRILASRHAAA